ARNQRQNAFAQMAAGAAERAVDRAARQGQSEHGKRSIAGMPGRAPVCSPAWRAPGVMGGRIPQSAARCLSMDTGGWASGSEACAVTDIWGWLSLDLSRGDHVAKPC